MKTEERSQKTTASKISVTHINIRQSISFLVIKLVLFEIFSAFGVVVFHSILLSTSTYFGYEIYTNFLNLSIYVILVFGKISINIYIILNWLTEYYDISSNFIIHKRGVFFQKEEKFSLKHIQSYSIKQGIFGKFLNYGTIEFYDWNHSTHTYLYRIHNPFRYLHILEELLPDVDEDKQVIRGSIKSEE